MASREKKLISALGVGGAAGGRGQGNIISFDKQSWKTETTSTAKCDGTRKLPAIHVYVMLFGPYYFF